MLLASFQSQSVKDEENALKGGAILALDPRQNRALIMVHTVEKESTTIVTHIIKKFSKILKHKQYI